MSAQLTGMVKTT